MRTSIEIDDKLLDEAMHLGKHKSKKVAIDEALKRYVGWMKRMELLKLPRKGLWEGNLNEMRGA